MMTYQEVLDNAKKNLAPKCRVCRVCNGVACRGEVPGAGGKGTGSTFVRNVEKLGEITLNMDVLYENQGQDSAIELFGHTFEAPVFAAPIGGMAHNYTPALDEAAYTQAVVDGCVAAGVFGFTGDGVNDLLFDLPLDWIKAQGGVGIPTIKPWGLDVVLAKIAKAKAAGAMALCMDVDSAGLPFLAAQGGDAGPKSPEVLAKIMEAAAPLPFIIKGIMTPGGAMKAVEAGAWGIVVSNHGGRVQDDVPATCEVLPGIRKAVGSRAKIFVDGGVRTGVDVFKMLALGADGVLIGRPIVTAAYGGKAQGVTVYLNQVIAQLRDTMKMTGCHRLADIGPDKLYR